jgi:protein-S-isoprenylcysteine O-methyltransferase Ste14
VPLLIGIAITAAAGDPYPIKSVATRTVGAILVASFVGWNGWALWIMARERTALLPGRATRVILDRGPFGLSRNPLYVGLIILDTGLALLWPSGWALLFVPVGVAGLRWGAILPEERYLSAKFGSEYADYRRRVRRWL